jgi:hypothetical protein
MATDTKAYSFPSLAIPESEKNEEWHRQFTLAIINRSLNNNYDINYAAQNESVEFFNGTQTGDEFDFLMSAEDGEVLPATWINYNRIRNRVLIMLGELQKKSYAIKAVTVNKDAKTRKLQEKESARVRMRLAPEKDVLAQETGLPNAIEGFTPTNEAELDDFYEYTFKEKNEIIMEHALRFITKKMNWRYKRMSGFRNILIQGAAFSRCEIENGLPFVRDIDPRYMVFDTNATDDFLSDSTFFGEVRYMALGDAAAKYNMSLKSIKEVADSYQQFLDQTNPGNVGTSSFGALNGTSLNYFNSDGTDLRVLVLSAVWLDYKKIKHKTSKDKYGNEHVKRVSDKAQNGDLTTNNVAIWRKATLIGGKLLTDWGEVENQVRENDAMAETSCPYKALLPHYMNGKAVSIVDQLKGLQKLKDVTMYNIQLAMARAGAKGFIYDISQVPDGWDIHNVIKYLKTAGIAFIDSKKDGLPSTHNQFQAIDQTLSSSIEQYININNMIDAEMDSISGINDARRGESTGASQAVGVMRSALVQSNLATEAYYDLFNQYNNNILNHLAGLVKLSVEDNDRFAPIIGDVGFDFLKETTHLELDDFGVFLEEVPPLVEDLQNFQALVQAALQAGQIDFADGLDLMLEKDIIIGVQRFKRSMAQKEAEAMKQQQAQMQAAMQAQQAEQQSKAQLEMGKIEKKGQYDLEKQRMENEGDAQSDMIKGKIGIAGKKIDFSKELMLNKLKQSAEKRKQNA